MSFKPKSANKTSTSQNDNPGGLFPVPKAGSRKARISLIVDLGEQNREDFEDEKTGEKRPQKPCQQIAVFADLVADTVDYGGEIGKQHYRLLLNKSFAGDIQGINFTSVPPKDAKGAIIPNKPWSWHPANLLSKLAKAVGKPELIVDQDVEQLLGLPFMAQVEVNEKDSGKEDKDGEPIIYRNVNYKGCAEVPLDDDDQPLPVAELKQAPRCITFDNATVDDIKYLRKKLIEMIKLANDYSGSQMEKAIKAFETKQGAAKAAEPEDDGDEETKVSPPKPAAKAAKPKAKPAPVEDDEDDSGESPF